MSEDPQQAAPAEVPAAGDPVPQHVAAAMAGPDNMKMPPNPLTQKQGSGSIDRDWEASFKGLNSRYREEKDAWAGERQQLTQQIQTLAQRMETLENSAKPAAPKTPPAPVSDGNRQQDDGVVYDRLAELEAERYRDSLLFSYMQPGQLGHNLPLALFRDNIPVVPPDVNDDGSINDKGQREAIERFIKGLQGIGQQSARQTQEAMTQGWTPGASPGLPQAKPTEEQLLEEYYRVKEAYGNVSESMPQDEVQRLQARYYQLHEEVGKRAPHQTTPWMTGDEMAKRLNQLEAQLGRFQAMYKGS